ncbi:GIY-YIG nuclease family protein [Aeromonas hydrophila]|uniref:GIY-YIG nuclease family protein n=1 Tax=Aeromonas hydrophila TaxID=644 RepID=UPI0013DFD955|nr:GIY-YIG nuclease family protein [Aeromonas hydrophila]
MKAEDYIGSEFVTPSGGIIKLVEIVGKGLKGRSLFGCTCSVCSEDKELYPKLFVCRIGNLTSGHIPCGCSSRHTYNEEQNIIRVIRKVNEKNITFHGWANQYTKINKTNCDLSCNICDYRWSTTRASNIINQGVGCPSCAKTGYDSSKAGTFYIVEWTNNHKQWVKFGITNRNPKTRFIQQKSNTTNTYKVLSLHYFEDGTIPPELERLVKPLKDKYPSGITKEIMPDGYSETLSLDGNEELYKILITYNNKR